MEFPLHATEDGVVEQVSCKEGRPVQPGEALLSILSAEEALA